MSTGALADGCLKQLVTGLFDVVDVEPSAIIGEDLQPSSRAVTRSDSTICPRQGCSCESHRQGERNSSL